MHPILFSAAMSTALRDGSKTQTRRIIAPQFRVLHAVYQDGSISTNRIFEKGDQRIHCPYGKPGDKLWIRETYYQRGHWQPIEGARTKGGRQKWAFIPADDIVIFDPPSGHRKGMHKETPDYITWHKRLARFMPRKYSRTTLEITSIRAQPLQEISEEDAIAEGVQSWIDSKESSFRVAAGILSDEWNKIQYRYLWESLHGPSSWQENPFVWVITFRLSVPSLPLP